MARRIVLLMLSVVFSVRLVVAQDTADTFRTALLNRQVYLRDFDADNVVLGHWANKVLEISAPQVRTLGVITIKAVKVKGNYVEIQGKRQTLVLRKDMQLEPSAASNDVRIRINFDKSDAVAALQSIPQALFFSDASAARAAVPAALQQLVPMEIGGKPAKADPTCDCADTATSGCAAQADEVSMHGITAPKILKSVEPEFSPEARQKKVSGDVVVALQIATDGTPRDFWITQSAGLGLDENALAALRQYKFAPAACHGAPVPVRVDIKVNFTIF